MTFSVEDAVSLVTWIIFIYWEPYAVIGSKARNWYSRQNRAVRGPPAYIFPVVWTILKGLIVASIFLYLKSLSTAAVDSVDWRYLSIYILFLINIIVAKLWSAAFFKYRKFKVALFIATILVATIVPIIVFMGISSDIVGNMWPVPMSLMIPYGVWLAFAWYLNFRWIGIKEDQTPLRESRFQ